jgi:N-acetylglutamate synthase-like GNAT family acetyltransferase
MFLGSLLFASLKRYLGAKTDAYNRVGDMLIRDFELGDADQVVEILKLNDQYGFPEVDGPEAMTRVKSCDAAVFLACEVDGKVVGAVRGTYDGSRAIIHQLSVHPKYKRQGVGTALVKEIVKRFRKKGAPTVSATITEESLAFWQKAGFRRTKAFLVGNW